MTQKRFRRLLMSCGVGPRIADAYVQIVKRNRLPYGLVLQGLARNSLADRWLMYVVLDCHGIMEEDPQGGHYAWTNRRGAVHRFTELAPEICAVLPEDWLRSRMVNVSWRNGRPAKVKVIVTQKVKEDKEK